MIQSSSPHSPQLSHHLNNLPHNTPHPTGGDAIAPVSKAHKERLIHAQTHVRRRITWSKVKVYRTIYKTKRGDHSITITSLTPPSSTIKLRGAGGLRRYTIHKSIQQTREVIIMAKSAKKRAQDTKDIEDDELDDLDELEAELDDTEEDDTEDEDTEDDAEDDDLEDEDLDEDDEDEDDEEPTPKSKKSSKSSSKKTKPSRSRTTDGKIGTAEVAAHFGVDARTLRMVLRKHAIEKDDETSRYEWSSLKHPVVLKIGKLLKGGAAKEAKKESLDKVKGRKKSK